jgi:hypothetical protein
MSLLSRFARKGAPAPVVADLPADCRHWELAPRWGNAEDIGRKDRVTHLTCTNCGESFSPAQAERLRAA